MKSATSWIGIRAASTFYTRIDELKQSTDFDFAANYRKFVKARSKIIIQVYKKFLYLHTLITSNMVGNK